MILLATGFLIEFIIAFILAKGDFFRPSVIVSGIMFTASVCAFYLESIWEFEIIWKTVILLLFPVLLMIFIDFISSLNMNFRIKSCGISEIRVSSIVLISVVVFEIIICIWHLIYLRETVGDLGSLSLMIKTYRQSIVWGTLTNVMPSLLSRFIRIMSDFSFIFLYIFINNYIINRKIILNLKYIIPTLVYCLDSLLFGARGYILYMIFSASVYFYVLYQRSTGWKVRKGLKIVGRILTMMIISAVAFVMFAGFVGRSTSGNFFYQLSVYFGGGIALLNDFFSGGENVTNGFGSATFVTLNKFLERHFGKVNHTEYEQFEFRSYNGYSMGNIYTPIRRYYQDFGETGVFIMVALFAVFFGVYYTKLKKKKFGNSIDFPLLYYGILIRAQFLFFIDDELFTDFLTPSVLTALFELWLCLLFIRLKIVRSGNRIKILWNEFYKRKRIHYDYCEVSGRIRKPNV